MKILMLIALALTAACKKEQVAAVQKAAEDARAGDTAATQAVQGYQRNVEQAEAARDKANAAIQQRAQTVEE